MVIVTTRTSPGAGSGDDGYRATADRMMELATSRDGFLDVDTVRGADRRADAEHVEAQRCIGDYRRRSEGREGPSVPRKGRRALVRHRRRADRSGYPK